MAKPFKSSNFEPLNLKLLNQKPETRNQKQKNIASLRNIHFLCKKNYLFITQNLKEIKSWQKNSKTSL